MVLIAFRHGLRASELCDLRWDQVDFARAALHVRRVKSGTPSTHPLTAREMRALRRLRREAPASPFMFVFGARVTVHNGRLCANAGACGGVGSPRYQGAPSHAAARMWLRAGEPRTRYPRPASLPGASVHPAHGALHRAVVRSVQGLVERLGSVIGESKVSTDPAQMRAHSPLTPAERMRAYRRRRREGSFFVRVQLDPPDIDGLVRRKLLRPGQRQDTEALQVAVQGLIYQVLDGV